MLQETPASKTEETTRDNFQRAVDFYAPIVMGMKAKNKLLDVTAVVVANLCVSYIMNERNHEAEELMKQVEQEEEIAAEAHPGKRVSDFF
jgi:tetratricopeptide repeat protein 30